MLSSSQSKKEKRFLGVTKSKKKHSTLSSTPASGTFTQEPGHKPSTLNIITSLSNSLPKSEPNTLSFTLGVSSDAGLPDFNSPESLRSFTSFPNISLGTDKPAHTKPAFPDSQGAPERQLSHFSSQTAISLSTRPSILPTFNPDVRQFIETYKEKHFLAKTRGKEKDSTFSGTSSIPDLSAPTTKSCHNKLSNFSEDSSSTQPLSFFSAGTSSSSFLSIFSPLPPAPLTSSRTRQAIETFAAQQSQTVFNSPSRDTQVLGKRKKMTSDYASSPSKHTSNKRPTNELRNKKRNDSNDSSDISLIDTLQDHTPLQDDGSGLTLTKDLSEILSLFLHYARALERKKGIEEATKQVITWLIHEFILDLKQAMTTCLKASSMSDFNESKQRLKELFLLAKTKKTGMKDQRSYNKQLKQTKYHIMALIHTARTSLTEKEEKMKMSKKNQSFYNKPLKQTKDSIMDPIDSARTPLTEEEEITLAMSKTSMT